MCLATVYVKKGEESGIIAKNVSGIQIDGGSVTLTDILGAEIVVEGRLKKADLVNGVVEIIAF
ncbi:MAG: CooT family nickel-binding protein [Clostridiales bacterium]|jgi:predicted RNA-binding protein|nr:CooT family nickel-binding protein [Clostridiales bacterium]